MLRSSRGKGMKNLWSCSTAARLVWVRKLIKIPFQFQFPLNFEWLKVNENKQEEIGWIDECQKTIARLWDEIKFSCRYRSATHARNLSLFPFTISFWSHSWSLEEIVFDVVIFLVCTTPVKMRPQRENWLLFEKLVVLWTISREFEERRHSTWKKLSSKRHFSHFSESWVFFLLFLCRTFMSPEKNK